ncbi:heme-binding protein [Phyllobacterium myrsinacearum]
MIANGNECCWYHCSRGGVTFGDDGGLIGAIGVSGGTPEQDAVLAHAAAA